MEAPGGPSASICRGERGEGVPGACGQRAAGAGVGGGGGAGARAWLVAAAKCGGGGACGRECCTVETDGGKAGRVSGRQWRPQAMNPILIVVGAVLFGLSLLRWREAVIVAMFLAVFEGA